MAAVVVAFTGAATIMAAGTIGMAAGTAPATTGRTCSWARRFSFRGIMATMVAGEADITVVMDITAVITAAIVAGTAATVAAEDVIGSRPKPGPPGMALTASKVAFGQG